MSNSIVVKGKAASKNGQELGIANELKLLNCIGKEGWIREPEASLITGMSLPMVGRVGRRLAEKEQIYRDREKGNAGYFLRLKSTGAARVDGKSGKDISIPGTWRHHALAIQSLNYLATLFKCEFESEANLRHRLQGKKIPDGRLIGGKRNYHYEQEFSRKSGPSLKKQVDAICQNMQQGTACLIGYPYPPEYCGGINHEIRHTNAIRHRWGSPDAPYLRLIRCHFDSLLAFQNMRVSRFEMIPLPALFNTPAASKVKHVDQVAGFQWKMVERNRVGLPRQMEGELWHDKKIYLHCVFTEGTRDNETHWLESNFIDRPVPGDYTQETFEEFIQNQKALIVRNIETTVNL